MSVSMKTENIVVVGFIGIAIALIIVNNPQAVPIVNNIVSGLLGYMSHTVVQNKI